MVSVGITGSQKIWFAPDQANFQKSAQIKRIFFIDMMVKYCDANEGKVKSKMAATNTNFGLVIIDSNSETFEEEKTLPSSYIHWTNFLDIIFL